MKSVAIIPPGTEVDLAQGLIGRVTEVCISKAHTDGEWYVQYKCVWWDGKTRQHHWLEEMEVTAAKDERLPVGFKGTE